MPWDIWLIFLVLGVILPWRGRMRMKKLLAMPHVSTTERLALYASTIAFQWVAVAVVAWRAKAHRFTPSQRGFANPERKRNLFAPGACGPVNPGPSRPDLPRGRERTVESRGPLPCLRGPD